MREWRYDRGHLPMLSTIGAVNEIQRCDNAEIKRCLADRLAVKYRARMLVSVAHKGRRASPLNQPRVKKMDHSTAVWKIAPPLYLRGIFLALTVFDGPSPSP